MKIRTRMCTSIDGYVTRPDGWPAQLADPDWSPENYGFVEFQATCDAVLMGRTTFEPALGAEREPVGGVLDVAADHHPPVGGLAGRSHPQPGVRRVRPASGRGGRGPQPGPVDRPAPHASTSRRGG